MFEKPTEFHSVEKQGKTNDSGWPKLCHFLGMGRLVPKRHVFTVSKKFQSRGWTASVCENGSTGAHGGCLVRLPCPCRVKTMTASCCLEQVRHIPSLELSWCPSGSVLVKTELCTVEGVRAQGSVWALGPSVLEFHCSPKAVFETSKWNCLLCLCCRGGWGLTSQSSYLEQRNRLTCFPDRGYHLVFLSTNSFSSNTLVYGLFPGEIWQVPFCDGENPGYNKVI